MRISKVSIKNHSRIRDLDLEVRQHAVIVGSNDVGKSSILRLLNLLLGASNAGLYQALTPADLDDPETPLVVEVTMVEFDDDERRVFPSEISIGDDARSEDLRVQLTVDIDPDDEGAVLIRRWFPDGGHRRSPNRDQIEAFGWRYLRATRTPNGFEGPRGPVRALLAAAELGLDRARMQDLLVRFNAELAESPAIADLLHRVTEHLSRAMPRPIDEQDLVVRSNTDPAGDVLEGVSLYLKRQGLLISLSEQSDGLRQLMAMTLFDLAEDSANVIAVDEPEIHLHPTSQRTVASLLSSERNQKFVVTHSPYILHRFDPSEVIAVDRHGNCHQVGRERLSKIEKVRAHWWSPRLLEALTARFVLLVEGDADRVIVEAVSENMGVDLDRLGAVVLELDGADKFKNVYPILGPEGFGPTLLGLVDEAEASSWLGAFGGKPTDIENLSIFISREDLEAEYSRAFGGPELAKILIDGGYCRLDAILSSAKVSSVQEITPEAVARYCRKKGKVEAAVLVAENLDANIALRINSVAKLVRRVDELSK